VEEILSKKHHRRTFYVVVTLVLTLALVIRFFVVPYFDKTLAISTIVLFSSLLDNLVISLFLAVFIGAFVFWITPDIVKRSTIEVLEPKQINSLLKAATVATKSWVYKGACGRYTRATTLPKLAEAARLEGIGRDITICILNPKNDELCAEYATYRRSLKSGKSGIPWTRQVVQEEILSTAVSALKYQFSEPILRIRVFFVDSFSAFRLDISDQHVFVTKEEKEASALKADAGTYFYDSYKDDVRLTERQASALNCCGKLEFNGLVDEKKLFEAVRCADLIDIDRLQELSIERIIQSINAPQDPY
jgi:hypothetical protein